MWVKKETNNLTDNICALIWGINSYATVDHEMQYISSDINAKKNTNPVGVLILKLSNLFHQTKQLHVYMQDAMDELNGRAYDGRDLRIRLDEGRPRSVFKFLTMYWN